ncbi:MAG: virulence factor [Pseudomonadota bacterium]
MPDSVIVFWRDIPAQVIVGKGRRAAKVQLSERFEQAIDRAAMVSGAAATDDYLAEWRKAAGPSLDGENGTVAEQIAAELEADYGPEKLRALIKEHGREPPEGAL